MKPRDGILICFLLLPLVAGCGFFGKGTHNAGKNCMWFGCHGYEAPAWSYAGTVFTSVDRSSGVKGVTVQITDATGERKLKSNSAGNFYTSKGDPAGGYRASVLSGGETREMPIEPTSGACNSCHAPGGEAKPLHID